MSYSFDGGNDRLTGTLGTTYGQVGTLFVYLKIVDHPIAAQCVVMVGAGGASQNSSLQMLITSTDNQFACRSRSGAGANADATTTVSIDGVWTPILIENTTTANRNVYVGSTAQVGNNTTSNDPGTAWDEISIGELLSGTADLGAANPNQSLVAEVTFWNTALSSDEKIALLDTRVRPNTLATAPVLYYALDVDGVLTNEGSDTGGDLTAAGTVFNADHPTFAGSTAKKRRRALMGVG